MNYQSKFISLCDKLIKESQLDTIFLNNSNDYEEDFSFTDEIEEAENKFFDRLIDLLYNILEKPDLENETIKAIGKFIKAVQEIKDSELEDIVDNFETFKSNLNDLIEDADEKVREVLEKELNQKEEDYEEEEEEEEDDDNEEEEEDDDNEEEEEEEKDEEK